MLSSFSRITVRNPQGQITLYSKGADTIIFDLLDPSNEDLLYTTSEHLNVRVEQLEQMNDLI